MIYPPHTSQCAKTIEVAVYGSVRTVMLEDGGQSPPPTRSTDDTSHANPLITATVIVTVTDSRTVEEPYTPEDRVFASKDGVLNDVTFTNKSDVDFTYSETGDDGYIYIVATGTASAMTDTQASAFTSDGTASAGDGYVVLAILLHSGETISFQYKESWKNESDTDDYYIVVVQLVNYGYYQFKIDGQMYVVDFTGMAKAGTPEMRVSAANETAVLGDATFTNHADVSFDMTSWDDGTEKGTAYPWVWIAASGTASAMTEEQSKAFGDGDKIGIGYVVLTVTLHAGETIWYGTSGEKQYKNTGEEDEYYSIVVALTNYGYEQFMVSETDNMYDGTMYVVDFSGMTKVTVTGLAVADEDKSIIFEINQDGSEAQIQINVYVVFSEGTYTTYTNGLTWTYDGSGAVGIDYVGSSATITATAVGEGTITVSLDGTGYCVEIGVSITDSGSAAEGVLASVSVDFSDSESYSWINFTNSTTPSDSTGLMTAHTRSSGNAWAINSNGDAMRTQGATTSDAGYFSVNLSEYAGNYVTVDVEMANTGISNGERSLFLSSSASTTSVDGNVFAYAPSVTNAVHTTLSHTMYIETGMELYITWSGSIDIYKIEITILSDAVPTTAAESVVINESGLSLKYDPTAGEPATGTLTATVTVQDGTYTGGYFWSSSDTDVVMVSGNGTDATVTVVGAGSAAITVVLMNSPTKSATCTVTVDAMYEITITGVPETTLKVNLGTAESFTFSVVVKKDGTVLDSSKYDVAVEINETQYATESWDQNTNTITIAPVEVGQTYVTITVSVADVVLTTTQCNISVVDPNAEVTEATYTVHFTVGNDGFVTQSVIPDDESNQVEISYAGTWSESTSGRNYTYTDEEGNGYTYTTGLKIKTYNSSDVKIVVPTGATDITITFVVYNGGSSERTASLTDSSGNALATSKSMSTSGETDVVTQSGLGAGEYHITATNDLYLLGVFVTYTI